MREESVTPTEPEPASLRLWTEIPGRFAEHARTRPRAMAVDALLAVEGLRLAEARRVGDDLRLRFDACEPRQGWLELRAEATAPRLGGGLTPSELPEGAIAHLGRMLRELESGSEGPIPGEESALLRVFEPVLSPADELPGGWRWTDIGRLPGAPDGWELRFSSVDGGAHHVVVPDLHPTRVEDHAAGASSAAGRPDPHTATLRALVQLAVALARLEPAASRVVLAAVEPAESVAEPETRLSQADIARFHRDGYLVVPGVVGPEARQAIGEAVRWFLSLDPTWDGGWFYDIVPYLDTPGFQRSGTFLELYQHQALWDVRQSPEVHRVFADLWGRDDLWVSVDRLNVKPPVRDAPADEWRDPGFVHWDVDTSELPLPFAVQGLVALTDAGPEHGTFHCAPGFHHQLEAYAAEVGPDRDPRRPGEEVEVIPVSLRAGDLLVWHHALPHGNGENRSAEVRIAQYVAMSPARHDNEHERLQRIRAWRERLPGGADFEGDPLERERRFGVTAELTTLGRRLLGLERWP